MPSRPAPIWLPISHLAHVASMIDGMLESAEEQVLLLTQAQPKAHVLDDSTIGRVFEVYTIQRDDLWLYAEQLHRWEEQHITDRQRRIIGHLITRLERLRQDIARILDLADALKDGTIEKILAKDDVALGLETLTRYMRGQDPFA